LVRLDPAVGHDPLGNLRGHEVLKAVPKLVFSGSHVHEERAGRSRRREGEGAQHCVGCVDRRESSRAEDDRIANRDPKALEEL
jgi:hypothetical protein